MLATTLVYLKVYSVKSLKHIKKNFFFVLNNIQAVFKYAIKIYTDPLSKANSIHE